MITGGHSHIEGEFCEEVKLCNGDHGFFGPECFFKHDCCWVLFFCFWGEKLEDLVHYKIIMIPATDQIDIAYLKSEAIGEVIAKGLAAVYKAKPGRPIDYLAKWLLNYSKR